jgi:large subunit ribosomal protein L21
VVAIIRDGGHQYRVDKGDRLKVQKKLGEPGSKITFGEVLFLNGKIGSPTIKGATVEAVIEVQDKAPKIHIVKYKRRKNYRRKTGHRQPFTQVRITDIVG